ncbi:glycosyltransferase family 2 protein [Baekduia sp. Peel2402]|uniref:glycosyltransferase family 2 protein n=1 Tax=Baekduia sp. Peel2402 TaxID=3458296 RepID=UPI00403EF51C
MSQLTPTVSALVAVYNGERFVAETIDSILAQTHAPLEVIVVDDGSTDSTAEVLARFGDRIRVIRQENRGCPGAFNTAFAAAQGDYLAMCGADDLWTPEKLEWQLGTLAEHPDVDVSIGAARIFGTEDDVFEEPGVGRLDPKALAERLFPYNIVCASSILFRRTLAQELGPFVENTTREEMDAFFRGLGVGDVWDAEAPGVYKERFSADDYDYWLRALDRGAIFHYDPRPLVRYRRHEDNVTNDWVWGYRSCCIVHHRHARMIEDKALVKSVLAADLFRLGRRLEAADLPREAGVAFRASLRQKRVPRVAAWALIVALPDRPRRRLGPTLVSLKRAVAGGS